MENKLKIENIAWEKGDYFLIDWAQPWVEGYRNVSEPFFSPDFKRIAAQIQDEKGITIAVDGVVWTKRFSKLGMPVFSSNSKHVATWVQSDPGRTIVIDNMPWHEKTEEKWFDYAGTPEFSFDGKNVACPMGWNIGNNPYFRSIAINKLPWSNKKYLNAGIPTFSPNGRKVAARVELFEGGWTFAVDDEPWNQRFAYAFGSPVFSPDNRQVAGIVGIDFIGVLRGMTVAVDGEPWDVTFENAFSANFSPDGKSIAAAVMMETNKQTIAINGNTWENYFPAVGFPQFTYDNRHLVAPVGISQGNMSLAIDGHPLIEQFESIENLELSIDGLKARFITRRGFKYFFSVRKIRP